MSIDTTFFTFKINVLFKQWASVYDSEEIIKFNNYRGIICLFKGLKKEDPSSVIRIEQGEEGKSKAMFEDPAMNPLIETAGHIYD